MIGNSSMEEVHQMTVDVRPHPDADRLLRDAHTAAYRHPADFGGFSAALVVRSEQAAAEGEVTLRPGEPPRLTLEEGELQTWAMRELASMAAHRWHREYDDGDGRHDKQLGPDDGHPLGRRVALEDDMRSSFRVLEGALAEITRTHDESRFTIVIQDRMKAPDGRTVSSSFTVFYWAEDDGRLTRTDCYRDGYVARDRLLLPTFRQVASAGDSGLTVRRLELSQHELLEEVSS
jgi:Protein of unknown function (DUF3386)